MMMTWSALDLIVSSDLQYGQKMMVSTQPIFHTFIIYIMIQIKFRIQGNNFTKTKKFNFVKIMKKILKYYMELLKSQLR